ncbi:MAG: hypothetical protein IKV88_09715 [Clostridia bacterium]|nr:hypothetical protein [Clostridia bacterium]
MICKKRILALITSLIMISSMIQAPCLSFASDDERESVQVEVLEHSLWDLDFESQKFQDVDPRNPKYRYFADMSGTRLETTYSGVHSTLTAHTGSNSNDITIEDSGDSDHNRAVKFSVADNSQAQLNEFITRMSGGIIKLELDTKYDVLPSNVENLSVTVMNVELAPDPTGRNEDPVYGYQILYKDSKPYLCLGDGLDVEYVQVIEEDTWYNLQFLIDFDTYTIAAYLDGEKVDETQFDSSYTWVEKSRVSFTNCAGTVAWIDNFKAEKIRIETLYPGINFTCPDASLPLPEGTKIRAEVVTEAIEGLEYINIVTDSGEIIETIEDARGTAWIPLPKVPTVITANAYDADGNLLEVSDEIEICGNPVVSDISIWDTGFETEYFATNEAAPEWRYLSDENGTRIYTSAGGAQSELTAHTGTVANEIKIEDSMDAEHGNAIKMTVTDSAQVQFNEFSARATNSTVVAQLDIKFEQFPTNTSNPQITVMSVEAAPDSTGQNEKGADSLNMKYLSGTPYFYYLEDNTEKIVEEAELNKWYNIKIYTDLINSRTTILLDGKFVRQSTFDSSLIWTDKYRVSFKESAGVVAWVDNFKVETSNLITVPKIISASSDAKTLSLEFVQPIDEDIFLTDNGTVKNITASFGENKLKFVDLTTDSENPNIIHFETDKEIFTGVPIDIKVEVPYIDSEMIVCGYTYTAPFNDFDVVDMNATFDGSSYDITATFLNNSQNPETVVMVASFYDEEGNTICVRVSPINSIPNDGIEKDVTMSGEADAEYMKVFFIKDWQSGRAQKNITYNY